MLQYVRSKILPCIRVILLFAFMAGWLINTVSPVGAASPQGPSRLMSVGLDSAGSTLVIQTDRTIASYSDYTALKLVSPTRLVIDLPETTLAMPANAIEIQRNGIQRIEFTQSDGTFYNAVRLTIFVDNYNILKKLNTVIEGNQLRVHLEEGAPPVSAEPFPTTTANPVTEIVPAPQANNDKKMTPVPRQWTNPLKSPAGRNVINDVFYRDDQLTVLADPSHPNSQIVVKNRFVLNQPTRLVLDLDNAVVASKSLQGTITIRDNAFIRSVRVGQFDEQTVRLVIETPQPERFDVHYPGPDKRLMAVSGTETISLSRLPKDTPLGVLEKISLDLEKGTTVLRLTTSTPIVHRLRKQGDQVFLELLNIAAHPGWVGYDQQNFPQIKQMRVEPLVAGQPNSKYVIHLRDPQWEISTRAVNQDRTLEISLNPVSTTLSVTRLPYRARVVVDAGHGGKDQGASREGYQEKHLNLSLALKLKKALEERGVQVHITRSSDTFLALSEITGITNRVRPDAFVSIHHNASVNTAISGIETYFYTPQSRSFAEKIHRKMISRVGRQDRGVRRAMFYVIHHTAVPAVLCEIGYVSNSWELRQLADERQQEIAAQAIAEGVVDYLKSKASAHADTSLNVPTSNSAAVW